MCLLEVIKQLHKWTKNYLSFHKTLVYCSTTCFKFSQSLNAVLHINYFLLNNKKHMLPTCLEIVKGALGCWLKTSPMQLKQSLFWLLPITFVHFHVCSTRFKLLIREHWALKKCKQLHLFNVLQKLLHSVQHYTKFLPKQQYILRQKIKSLVFFKSEAITSSHLQQNRSYLRSINCTWG